MALFKNKKAELEAKKAAWNRVTLNLQPGQRTGGSAKCLRKAKTPCGKAGHCRRFLMCAFHIYSGIFGCWIK